MARCMRLLLLLLVTVLLALFQHAHAAQPKGRTAPRKPRRPPAVKGKTAIDKEVTRKRTSCGMDQRVTQPCIDGEIDVENCVMK